MYLSPSRDSGDCSSTSTMVKVQLKSIITVLRVEAPNLMLPRSPLRLMELAFLITAKAGKGFDLVEEVLKTRLEVGPRSVRVCCVVFHNVASQNPLFDKKVDDLGSEEKVACLVAYLLIGILLSRDRKSAELTIQERDMGLER